MLAYTTGKDWRDSRRNWHEVVCSSVAEMATSPPLEASAEGEVPTDDTTAEGAATRTM